MRFGEVLGGRFQLEGLAGAGGMGAIFRAVDLQTGRHAAVKVLLAQDRSVVERFEREASTLEDVDHPGVVKFLGSGKTSDGELYLAMQWLDGQDLSQRIEESVLSIEESVLLGKRVAEALDVVHARGIIHRDLKPSNILLVGGAVEGATLIDFGVALGQSTARRTKTGTIVGTPAYMAPEQARGVRELDARADVYSLGCVIFECLTGHPPYGGEQPVAILAKVLLEDAPRVASLRPDVPAWLDAAIAEMLSKDLALRPANGGEVVRRLDARAPSTPSVVPSRASVVPMSVQEQNWVSIVLVAPDPSVDAFARTASADIDQARLSSVIAPHEGRIEPLVDGALVITFSAGATAIDRSAKAARCALDVCAALPTRRVVLATGRAIARRGALPVGEVVDRALALLSEDAGSDAGVRVDDSTAALLGNAFRVRDGFLVGEEAPASREGTPFVGRDRELDVLCGLCEDTAAVARAVIVTGPAGSGKTRIAEELVSRLTELSLPPRIWRVRAEEISEGSAMRVAAQLVASEVGIASPNSERASKVEARVKSGAFADPRRVSDFLKEIVGAGGEAENVELRSARNDAMAMGDQMQRAFCDLVADVCARSPLVILVEDAHWADRASMKLLDAALRIHESAPLVIVAFARPEMEERFPSLWEERSTTTLALSPLAKRARERLVRHLLGTAKVTSDIVKDIVLRSEGNALVLCEMARAVREGRAQAMPDTAIAMMTARIEATSPEERQALRAASVFGERFWVGGVSALVGTDVAEVLGKLKERELVSERSSEIENERELAFAHALLRDAAYSMLTDDDKRTAHGRAYEWLERVGERDVIVLGEHAERGGLPDAAAKLFSRGAEYALEGIDLTGAIERAARAEKCGATGEALGHLRRVQTEAYFWRGEQREAADCGKQTMDLLPAGSSGWFQAASFASAGYARVSDLDAALAIVARMREAPIDATATSDRTAAFGVAAGFLALSGHIALAEEMIRDVKAAASRLADREPAVFARVMRARSILAGVKAHSGAYLELSIRTADLFMRAGDLRNMSTARANVAHAYIEHGAFEKAVEEAREALDAAERLGLRNAIALAKQNLGYALAMMGHPEEGLATLRESAAEYHSQGHKRMEGGSHIYIASIELERDAHRALAEAETALGALGQTPLAAYALALGSSAALRLGDPAQALDKAERAMSILEQKGSIDAGQADVFAAAVEAYAANGNRERAMTLLQRAREWLLARAAAVSDDALRATLLERVPANVRLLHFNGD